MGQEHVRNEVFLVYKTSRDLRHLAIVMRNGAKKSWSYNPNSHQAESHELSLSDYARTNGCYVVRNTDEIRIIMRFEPEFRYFSGRSRENRSQLK